MSLKSKHWTQLCKHKWVISDHNVPNALQPLIVNFEIVGVETNKLYMKPNRLREFGAHLGFHYKMGGLFIYKMRCYPPLSDLLFIGTNYFL